jgi:hypothetical protein
MEYFANFTPEGLTPFPYRAGMLQVSCYIKMDENEKV